MTQPTQQIASTRPLPAPATTPPPPLPSRPIKLTFQPAVDAVRQAVNRTPTAGRTWLTLLDVTRISEVAVTALVAEGWTPPGEYARLAKAVRNLLEAISDMPVRNSDVDDAAMVLRGELVDAGWDEQT